MSETVIRQYYHNNSSIIVTQTSDASYARDCFDGSEREWHEVLGESEDGNFYIVSSGLSGLYMADEVSVFGVKADALRSAADTYERWKEEDEETEAIA